MKKYVTAILVLNLMAGLLFLGLRESRGQIPVEEAAQAAADSVRGREQEEDRGRQEEDVRKIAITFDDEVIIGLSQEICCIEAISLI